MSEYNQVVDLDALVPEDKSVVVKIGGQELQVNQPTTATILRLGHLSQKLGDIENVDPEELDKAVESLTAEIKKCVPGLEDIELKLPQLLKLVEIIGSLSMPTDNKILEERGISTGDPKVQ